MANPIEQAARAIRGTLAELVGEQQQLQKALGALEGLLGSERGSPNEEPSASTKARRPPPPRASARARGRQFTATRRRAGPSRADQLLALVGERPGITVAEAADRLKTSRQTLYNVSARLQRDGRLRKDGRGFYPVEQPAAPQEGPEPPSASAS